MATIMPISVLIEVDYAIIHQRGSQSLRKRGLMDNGMAFDHRVQCFSKDHIDMCMLCCLCDSINGSSWTARECKQLLYEGEDE